MRCSTRPWPRPWKRRVVPIAELTYSQGPRSLIRPVRAGLPGSDALQYRTRRTEGVELAQARITAVGDRRRRRGALDSRARDHLAELLRLEAHVEEATQFGLELLLRVGARALELDARPVTQSGSSSGGSIFTLVPFCPLPTGTSSPFFTCTLTRATVPGATVKETPLTL